MPVAPAPALADAVLLGHEEDGRRWPLLVWAPGPGTRMVSSAVLGGGIGERAWVVNAQVPPGYARLDPVAHLRALAARAGLEGAGVGLMTAAPVADRRCAADGGAEAVVTAGIGVRGWAAVPDEGTGTVGPPRPGTVNIIVSLPVPLTDAALVNAVATATEAKVQALVELGADASGTPTDAVCVACPATGDTEPEPFAGPRSLWGARVARAVHRATREACAAALARGD